MLKTPCQASHWLPSVLQLTKFHLKNNYIKRNPAWLAKSRSVKFPAYHSSQSLFTMFLQACQWFLRVTCQTLSVALRQGKAVPLHAKKVYKKSTGIAPLRNVPCGILRRTVLTFRDNISVPSSRIKQCNKTGLLNSWRWDWYVVLKRRYGISIVRWVKSRKSVDLVYIMVEAWNHAYNFTHLRLHSKTSGRLQTAAALPSRTESLVPIK